MFVMDGFRISANGFVRGHFRSLSHKRSPFRTSRCLHVYGPQRQNPARHNRRPVAPLAQHRRGAQITARASKLPYGVATNVAATYEQIVSYVRMLSNDAPVLRLHRPQHPDDVTHVLAASGTEAHNFARQISRLSHAGAFPLVLMREDPQSDVVGRRYLPSVPI